MDILFLIFVILKICGVITWSWWWVFSPMFIIAIIEFCFLYDARITRLERKDI